MIKFQITQGTKIATVTVNSAWDVAAKIEYEGNDSLVKYLKNKIPAMYGYYGHLIGNVTTPADLHLALYDKEYLFTSVDVIEGSVSSKELDPLPRKSVS